MSEQHIFNQLEKEALLSIQAEMEKMANIGGWEWDIGTDKWTFSDNWRKIHGCTKVHLNSTELLKIVHPDDRLEIQKVFAKAVEQGEKYEIEHRIFRQDDGELRYIKACGDVKLNKCGKAVKVYGAAQDITEYALQNSTEFLRQVIDTSPNCIFVKDQDGKFILVNDVITSLYQCSMEEMLGRTDMELAGMDSLRGEEAEKFMRDDQEVIIHQRSKSVLEEPFTQADGTVRWFQTIKVPLQTPLMPDCILGVAMDVTDRKKFEETLYRSEVMLNQAQEIAGLGSYVWNIENDSLEWSKHMYAIAGLEPDQFYGNLQKTIDKIIHPDDRPHVKKQIEQMLNQGVSWPIEFRIVRPDGEIRFFRSSSRFSFDKNGKPIRCSGINFDITEKVSMEKERQNLEKQIQRAQKMESIGRLAGGIAHDMNNLLSPIFGYSEMLLDELGYDDKRREFVNEILNAGSRGRDLIRQLLAFSRKQTLEYKSLDLNKIIREFEKLLRRTIREDIDVKIIAGNVSKSIMADMGQIEQVIMNLAVNAQDAMPEGGCIVIETSIMKLDEDYCSIQPELIPGEYVKMAVSDTGCGMDEETLSWLFEPFYSTKEGLGTGLGLATVYGIIKQHKGHISVYSEPGKGTVFKIYLPVSHEASVAYSPLVRTPTANGGTETILLVEDDEQVRKLALLALTKKGYNVISAENGRRALDVLEADNVTIHLLLTDVIMPEMNGRELYESVVTKHPGVKVLYMSGYTDNLILQQKIFDGQSALVEKPFSIHELATRVRDMLDS